MRGKFAVIAAVLGPSVAAAQQVDPSTMTRPVIGPLLIGLLCYLARKRAIGGWLLLFYIALAFGAVTTILLAVATMGNLFTGDWDPLDWWLAIFDYFPWLLASIATWILGVRVAFVRDQKALGHMRIAMVALVITSWIGFFIRLRLFGRGDFEVFMAAVTSFSASIWCLYWFMSRRVKHVMTLGEGRWDYAAFLETK